MQFRISRGVRKYALVPFLFVILFLIAGNAYAQKVRLRGHIDPNCPPGIPTRPEWRYADIYADGNIAVQGTSGCLGVFIYDISNPDAPVLASHYNPGGSERFLEAIVVGNRGYFGSGFNAGVHIVDLTDPYSPILLGVVDAAHGNGFQKVHEMVVWGNYLIENFNGAPGRVIKFINISNPANPVFVREIVLQEENWGHAMHVRGNRMFTSGLGSTSTARGRTEIYDIGNIETQAPVLLGVIQDNSATIREDSLVHSSWTTEDGNYLYSCREDVELPGSWGPGDLRVYDIHNPAQPLLVNKISGSSLGLNASTPHNPVVKGNRLYVSWYQAGLQIFDISNPVHPVRIGQYDTYPGTFTPPVIGSDWAIYPFLGDDRVLAGDMNTGLYILDTTRIASPLGNKVSDFDGDGKTDLSKYTPATGVWQVESSSNGGSGSILFGINGDKLTTGDYDGDGRADVSVWRPSSGVWYSLNSSNGVFRADIFGLSGDIPVPGDYDADGRTDIAVWRPGSGVWYIQQSTLGLKIFVWGLNGDKPLVGDYEGDGKADAAIYRNGSWYILQSSSSLPMGAAFGLSSDKPLAGDFDGDGRSDLAVYRPATGIWYVLKSSDNSFTATHFGLPDDTPVSADYDGDGKTDVAIYRPSDGNWHILRSVAGYMIRNFGTADDIPSPSVVNPQ